MPALPGVIPELDSVVHDPGVPDSHGPMQGKLLPEPEQRPGVRREMDR